jgi:hypothetical protein
MPHLKFSLLSKELLDPSRQNGALDGKTPAEKAGIKIQGEDKWTTLIQNASKRDSAGRL